MFYFLSKTIDFLLMPLSICLMLLLYALLTRKSKRQKTAITVSLCILFIISNSYLVNKAFNWWEYRFVNISSIQKTHDVGIVLTGGMISTFDLHTDHPSMGGHSDRFVQAFLLYKAGKIKKILITGASPEPMARLGKGEARLAAQLLKQWGVPQEDIILEEKAKNTRENALFSAKILADVFPGGSYLLITSSFHMRRSVACFAKAGVHPDVYPADFYGVDFYPTFKKLLIPDPEVLGYFNLVWREWIGYVIYKAMGYC